MRKNLMLMSVVPLCLAIGGCGSSSSGEENPVDVIIMGGQSNMVGCSTYSNLAASVGQAKFDEYQTGYRNLKIAFDCWTKNGEADYAEQNDSNGKFVPSCLGEGNSDLTFGPEIGMAETFSVNRKDKLFLIKYACGASNLLDDWAAPSSGKRTTMYANFVAFVRIQLTVLKKAGYAPTIKAMCWMQGEGDSYPGYCEEYYNQLHFFVKDLRSEFSDYEGGTDFAFVDGGISDSTEWPKHDVVNAAKVQFASDSERNVFIDTIAEGLDKSKLQADNAHYIGPAMVTLGHLFAQAAEPFLSPLE